ncbi:hypothetical protein GOP47_0008190 [Adiantum capillus-veneris]|uniref:Tail specific protease domain-containing protein n=1 Tax=Adiantum capillus-veneris TaxID=13818 RepID=A0A9D4UXT0_ADICA|nr:hypothetical protein GOP47_0008190 [Adiantum capillus-veneris]
MESVMLGPDSHPLTNDPLIVLLNGNSASASEIVAGALHDNGRAFLLGQRSFGKGKIQSVSVLEDGSGLFVTIAEYLSPSLHDIDKKGITPDAGCSVPLADADGDDVISSKEAGKPNTASTEYPGGPPSTITHALCRQAVEGDIMTCFDELLLWAALASELVFDSAYLLLPEEGEKFVRLSSGASCNNIQPSCATKLVRM